MENRLPELPPEGKLSGKYFAGQQPGKLPEKESAVYRDPRSFFAGSFPLAEGPGAAELSAGVSGDGSV